MGFFSNLRDFFKDYTDYKPSVDALVEYLPEGDLTTLVLWRKRHIPYEPDAGDGRGLDNYNGADLTIKARKGDCESIAAVFVEVIRRWLGWEAWHVCFIFPDSSSPTGWSAHDVAVFVDPYGDQGWIDGQIYHGGYEDMYAFYRAEGWHIADWWVANDIGETVKELPA